ncbi:MAG TPA: hypothetical protein VMH32_13465 [Burkholderiales bacterium]|nr:hypothetical protein [Burkholderiales bacterium]
MIHATLLEHERTDGGQCAVRGGRTGHMAALAPAFSRELRERCGSASSSPGPARFPQGFTGNYVRESRS